MANRARVLIAEDDENDRFLINRAFTKAGTDFSITFACNGQEAIEHLQKADRFSSSSESQPHNLLLLDIKMPLIDGFQVLDWLAHNPAHRPAFVTVLSSSSDPKDIEQAQALGADSYLVKPHDVSEYIEIAQKLQVQIMSPLNLTRALTPAPGE